MVGLHYTQAEVDELAPERRARLLWNLHARRLVERRDAIAASPAFDAAAAQARSANLTAIDAALFPPDPRPTEFPRGKGASS